MVQELGLELGLVPELVPELEPVPVLEPVRARGQVLERAPVREPGLVLALA